VFCISVQTAVKSHLLTAFLQQHVERKQVEEGLEETLRYQQMAVPLDNRIVRSKHKRKKQKTCKDLTKQFRQFKRLKMDKQVVV